MAKQLTEVPRCEGCNRPVFAGETYCRSCRNAPVAPIQVKPPSSDATDFVYLEVGEIIQQGDEGFNSSDRKWYPYRGELIGKPASIARSSRRRLVDPAPAAPAPEEVNHPPRYQSGNGIECIDAIEAMLTPEEFRGFCKGNAMKYNWRERHKGGDQDLAKAAWYLNRLQKETR